MAGAFYAGRIPEYTFYNKTPIASKGQCELVMFTIEELLATKLLALYQRKQGKDLFDLEHAFKNYNTAPEKIKISFAKYIKRRGIQFLRTNT